MTPKENAHRIIADAYERHGKGLVALTSCGKNAGLLLTTLATNWPGIPILQIDPGDLPASNEKYKRALIERFALSVTVCSNPAPVSQEEWKLYYSGDEGQRAFYQRRKLEPLGRALAERGATAVLSGIRADQNGHRRSLAPSVMRGGIEYIYPFLDMTSDEACRFMLAHDVPFHPDGPPGLKKGMECGLHKDEDDPYVQDD